MKVRFVKDHTTEEVEPRSFKKDEVVDFYEAYQPDPHFVGDDADAERNRRARAQASAQHFVHRGLAVAAEDDEQVKAKAARGRTPPPDQPRAAEGTGAAQKPGPQAAQPQAPKPPDPAKPGEPKK